MASSGLDGRRPVAGDFARVEHVHVNVDADRVGGCGGYPIRACMLRCRTCIVTGVLGALVVVLSAGCSTAPAQAGDLSAEQSVKPGINERWKSDRIEPLVGTLESESREIYANRELLAQLVDPAPGSVVADVGAGSGFMVELFAQMVGPEGLVYAVDINPALMDHVASRAAELGLDNIETVVCTEKSVELPPASVDLVFVCDTYHHFEYPRNSLWSIHEALRPGGQLVVVEFERIPGVSREWVINHVRGGRETFTREITAAGFELVEVHDTPFFDENYVIRFETVTP